MPWTDSQREAIEHAGGDVLVAAGAGAGKTGVLTERVVRRVAQQGWSVTDVLVVTFTDAAAAEMRDRVARKLAAALAAARAAGDERATRRLANQIVLLDAGQICTLHSFCNQLLREHFGPLGLDPAFEILDPDEATLLQQETLDDLLAGRYNETGPRRERFERLLQWRPTAADAWLRETILRLDRKIAGLAAPDEWWQQVQRSLATEKVTSLADSAWNAAIHRLFELEFDAISARLDQARLRAAAEGAGGLSAYVKPIDALVEHLAELRRRMDLRNFWVGLAEQLACKPVARLAAVKNDVPGKEAVKGLIDTVRESLKELATLTARSERDLLADLAGLSPQMDVLAELCREYRDAYAAVKRDRGMLDFNDLERFTVRLLTEFPEVRESVSGRFHEVFVDEYQDISPVQDAIVRAVAGRSPEDRGPHGTPAVPLFLVGDLKQSIYRFRLAEPDIFAEMLDGFTRGNTGSAGSRMVHLAENFRSRRAIIDGANEVFARLMQPLRTLTGESSGPAYDDRAKLKFAAQPYTTANCPADDPVELHLLDWATGDVAKANAKVSTESKAGSQTGGESNVGGDFGKGEGEGKFTEDDPEETESSVGTSKEKGDESASLQRERVSQQARLVGWRINQLLGRDGSAPATVWDEQAERFRAARPRDIVILLRTAARVSQAFAEELTAMGLPVHAMQPGGYFEAVEVADVRALLAVLDNPRQDIPLAAVLRSPLMTVADSPPLSADELAAIRLSWPDAPFYDAVLAASGRNSPLSIPPPAGEGEEEDSPTIVDSSLRDRLARFLDRLSAWRTMARRRPVSELLADIFRVTGYADYVAGLVGGPQRQANLLDMADRGRQFDRFARQGLARFTRFLDELERSGEQLGTPSALSEADDVVRVQTIHASKGLQFPIVILADLEHQFNTGELGDDLLFHRQLLMGLRCLDQDRRIRYPSLPHHLIGWQLHTETLLEEMRLVYVAMTRARDRLILFGSRKKLFESLAKGWAAPLDGDSLLAVHCALDWLGPTILAGRVKDPPLPGGAGDSVIDLGDATFAIHLYPAGWLSEHLSGPADHDQPARPAWQEAALAGEPVSAQSPATDPADRLIHDAVVEQMKFAYPLAAVTTMPAKRSVSELKHLFETRAEEDELPSVTSIELPTVELDLVPPWEKPPASDHRAIGLATHAVLQRVDLSADLDDASQVRRQIETLRARRLLDPHSPDLVDAEAIAAFFSTDLGRQARSRPNRVRREWPFSLAVAARELDPSVAGDDRVLVQGIIDLLMDNDDGTLTVLDFKTDAVRDARAAAQRAQSYRVQIDWYSRAAAAILGRPVARRAFYFLSAGTVVDM